MTLRILNLEDNPNDTELTHFELSKEWSGFELVRVETREDFVRELEKNNFDLILADYNLPSFDGMSALKIVNEKYSEIPFIFLSGAMGEESAVETLKKGATDFVIKGRLFRLIPAIKRALEEALQRKKQKQTEAKIKVEMEITSHLLMIAEATAQITDIDKLIKQIVSCSHEIMKYDYCLFYLYNREADIFKPVEQFGLSDAMVTNFMSQVLSENITFVKESFIKKEPIRFGSLRDHGEATDTFTYLEEVESMVAIPLSARGEAMGIMVVFYKSQIEFGDRQKKIMLGVAHQTGVALDQARLYRDSIENAQKLSTRIETIQVMNEIDKSLLSTLNAVEILENVIHLVSRLVPCDRATVAIVDKVNRQFVYSAGFGVKSMNKGDVLPFDKTSASKIVETGDAEHCENLAGQANRLPFEEGLFNLGFLSYIRIPLLIQDEIAALLSLSANRVAAFSGEQISILKEISSQISVALHNARLVSNLEELFIGTVKSLSSAIDAKSHWTSGHSALVAHYAIEIGKKMKFTQRELKDLELGALLHDIGKLGTYESILDKPEKLTEEEYDMVKKHPDKGAEILSPIAQLEKVIPGIRHHHEYYNGEGYPDGLSGTKIPLMARILCVADSVDSMSSDRPYRKGIPEKEVKLELQRQAGIQFDPDIVKIFLEIYSGLNSFANTG